MAYEQITSERDGNLLILTLNRPERLNAWTHKMNAELSDSIVAANEDPEIGAIVITGSGRGFCAGADMRDTFQSNLKDAGDGKRATGWVKLLRQSKPVIAAVNGASVGVGATMILPCDVIIAAESARFGFAFVKMGVVPELASSHLLVQRIGFGKASEVCLTGKLYSASEANEFGLLNHLVPDEELMPTAIRVAREIAANPSPQLRMIKQLLTDNGSETDLDLIQKREGEALAVAYKSKEHKEAVQAFLEKREPNFGN
ncbi:MAG: enoyl-CoA hydratase-related protein [bacterium]|nr:enoyl-CoA hydratase [Gammaproteobacteria bacterium]